MRGSVLNVQDIWRIYGGVQVERGRQRDVTEVERT